MFLLRLTSPDSAIGVTSDDGFTIGQFSFVDTYNLLNLGGGLGIVGAAACIAAAPWLIGPRWFRLFTVGITAALLIGSMVLHPDGRDLAVLAPTWLAVVLFTALPFVAGVLLMRAADRAAGPQSWAAAGKRRWVVPAVLILIVPASAFPLVVVSVFVAVLLPVRRQFLVPILGSPWGLMAIRAAFLAIPVLALVALSDDLRALYG